AVAPTCADQSRAFGVFATNLALPARRRSRASSGVIVDCEADVCTSPATDGVERASAEQTPSASMANIFMGACIDYPGLVEQMPSGTEPTERSSPFGERARRRAAEDDVSPVVHGRTAVVDHGRRAGLQARRACDGPRVAGPGAVAAARVAADEAVAVAAREAGGGAGDRARAARFGRGGVGRAVDEGCERRDETARVFDLARRDVRSATPVTRGAVATAGRREQGAARMGPHFRQTARDAGAVGRRTVGAGVCVTASEAGALGGDHVVDRAAPPGLAG